MSNLNDYIVEKGYVYRIQRRKEGCVYESRRRREGREVLRLALSLYQSNYRCCKLQAYTVSLMVDYAMRLAYIA
jgi:hypothetical protein